MDWIRNTLGVVETDVNKGGRQRIQQAQEIAKGKYFLEGNDFVF